MPTRPKPPAAPPPRSLAGQLRDAMRATGRSATEIGLLARVDRRDVSRFLAGEKDLRLETAGRIAEAIGLRLTGQARGRGRPAKFADHPDPGPPVPDGYGKDLESSGSCD